MERVTVRATTGQGSTPGSQRQMLLLEASMQLLQQTTKSQCHQLERCRACIRFETGTFDYGTNSFRDHQPLQEPVFAAGCKNREPQLRHHTGSRILAPAPTYQAGREGSENPTRRLESFDSHQHGTASVRCGPHKGPEAR